MTVAERTGHKAEQGLAEVASALGPHLIDSTVARSDLEQALREAGAGGALRMAVLGALAAAQISVIEDLPGHLALEAHDLVHPPGQAADPRDSEAEMDRLHQLARRRLLLDRAARPTRLPKVILTAEEEVGLTLLARPTGAMLEQGDYADLVGEAREAADSMFMHNLGLAHSVAKKYVGQGLEYDDLVQCAMAGLLRAIERFDPFAGFKFSTYAMWWLRQSVTRSVANEGRLIRIPVHMIEVIHRVMATRERLSTAGEPATAWHLAKECDLAMEKVLECLRLAPGVISLDTPLGDDEFTLGDLVDAQVDRPEHIEVHGLFPEDVERLIGYLTLRQAEVLRMRFALAPYDQGLTLDEIGKVYGVTRERIRQIESKAITLLRTRLEDEGHVIEVPDKQRRHHSSGADTELAETAYAHHV